MREIDWSKAPEGCTHYVIGSVSPFEKRVGDDWFFWSRRGCFWEKLNIYSGNERIERSGLKIVERPSQAWNGEGLPPVGAAVDCKCTAKTKARDWFPAEVKYISPYTVVLVDYSTEELDGEFVAHPATLLFQPRRTPEQIAADEREAAIDEIEELIAGYSYRHCAEQIYKSGYRKQEKPE